jgi:hypothetical protein
MNEMINDRVASVIAAGERGDHADGKNKKKTKKNTGTCETGRVEK